jgi:hypothetical protein
MTLIPLKSFLQKWIPEFVLLADHMRILQLVQEGNYSSIEKLLYEGLWEKVRGSLSVADRLLFKKDFTAMMDQLKKRNIQAKLSEFTYLLMQRGFIKEANELKRQICNLKIGVPGVISKFSLKH